MYLGFSTNCTLSGSIGSNFSRVHNAYNFGGGLYLDNTVDTIVDSVIRKNCNTIWWTGSNSSGGGVYVNRGSNITLNGAITENMSTAASSSTHGQPFICSGGGVYITNASHVTVNGIVSSNAVSASDTHGTHVVYSYGGGIACFNSTSIVLNTNILSNAGLANTTSLAGYAYGGGIYYEGTIPVISGTVINNIPDNLYPPYFNICYFAINSNARTTLDTNVAIYIEASNLQVMMLSTNSTFADASWEPIVSVKPWTFLTNGTAPEAMTIYAKFSNTALGYCTEIILDKITIGQNNFYIATSGSDTNDGAAPSAPLHSVQKAIDMCGSNATIYISQGTYTPGNGLSNISIAGSANGLVITNMKNINLLGGYDLAFSAATGVTTLNGQNSRVLYGENLSNIFISNFQFTTGNAAVGAGIFISNATLLRTTNITVTGCYGPQGGGAAFIFLTNSSIAGSFINNTFTPSDPAAYNAWGCGVYLGYSTNCTLSGSISSNFSRVHNAYNFGGGLYLDNTIGTTVDSVIKKNRNTIWWTGLNSSGGGVYVNRGSNITLNGAITENMSTAASSSTHGQPFICSGGGVYITNASYVTVNAIVSSNTVFASDTHGAHVVYSYGGGIACYNSTSIVLNTNILSNAALTNTSSLAGYANGGGIYYEGAIPAVFGTVSNNMPNNLYPP
ncbi:MAG: hypothetical protein HZC28_13300 [Spirochaetes bacterium]|nr:hypothetical protein [Spirochaetota bacterium]